MDSKHNGNNQPQPDKKNPYETSNREILRAFGLVSAIGVDLAVCTIGGSVTGWWLDKLWGTAPWMLLLGIVLGLGAGIYGVIKLLQAFGPEAKKNK